MFRHIFFFIISCDCFIVLIYFFKMEYMVMTKSKKKMFQFSKNEFIFNIVSLVVVIGIALYFGGRSFYYYGLQSVNTKGGVQTLDGIIVNNNSLESISISLPSL